MVLPSLENSCIAIWDGCTKWEKVPWTDNNLEESKVEESKDATLPDTVEATEIALTKVKKEKADAIRQEDYDKAKSCKQKEEWLVEHLLHLGSVQEKAGKKRQSDAEPVAEPKKKCRGRTNAARKRPLQLAQASAAAAAATSAQQQQRAKAEAAEAAAAAAAATSALQQLQQQQQQLAQQQQQQQQLQQQLQQQVQQHQQLQQQQASTAVSALQQQQQQQQQPTEIINALVPLIKAMQHPTVPPVAPHCPPPPAAPSQPICLSIGSIGKEMDISKLRDLLHR
jgi:hypothetical protein